MHLNPASLLKWKFRLDYIKQIIGKYLQGNFCLVSQSFQIAGCNPYATSLATQDLTHSREELYKADVILFMMFILASFPVLPMGGK